MDTRLIDIGCTSKRRVIILEDRDLFAPPPAKQRGVEAVESRSEDYLIVIHFFP